MADDTTNPVPQEDQRRERFDVFHTDWSPEYCKETLYSRGFCNASEYWSQCTSIHLNTSLDHFWDKFYHHWPVDQTNQQDTVEFLNTLLNQLANCHSKVDTKLLHMLQSIVEYHNMCGNCHEEYSDKDYMWVIGANPDAEKTETIDHCIRRYMGPEIIEGYKCEKCGVEADLSRQMYIKDAPEVLVIQVNRFEPLFSKSSARVAEKVALTPHIDITGQLSPGAARLGETLKYQLTAIIAHRGTSVNSGHYLSYGKGPTGKWTILDDETSRTVSLKTALACHMRTATPYVLFYSREPAFAGIPEGVGSATDATGTYSVVESEATPNSWEPARSQTVLGHSSNLQLEESDDPRTAGIAPSSPVQLETSLSLPDIPDSLSGPSVAARWEGQPAEIMVQVTMGDMVLTSCMRGLLQRSRRSGPSLSKGNPPSQTSWDSEAY
ncbi:hypothetical protein FQN57_005582 [Myotisia sp. PD_48]|nr:hypothetical protein FQN57_005582 [Myotisia sp. PD_48]